MTRVKYGASHISVLVLQLYAVMTHILPLPKLDPAVHPNQLVSSTLNGHLVSNIMPKSD